VDGEISRLLGLQNLAAEFGCGLKPELHDMLLKHHGRPNAGVEHLDLRLKSSGPAHHDLSAQELAERGIKQLPLIRTDVLTKDGTDG